MSLLTPLYIAGLAAISLPILFHLIRRVPRDRRHFSSLMFLAPSPPRLTRRSRLDNWLLLLLRSLAIILLAVAFARPFFREAQMLGVSGNGRRLAILIDSSASMRRGDIWARAIKLVERELSELGPLDDVSVFTFDDQLRAVTGSNEESSMPLKEKQAMAKTLLSGLKPTWNDTDLGLALVTVGERLAGTAVADQSTKTEIVLISDLQKGTRLDALQGYAWPKDASVMVRRVLPDVSSGAYVRVMSNQHQPDATSVRVRVVNGEDSATDHFRLTWRDRQGQSGDKPPIDVHVPPGESRVVRVERPSASDPWVQLVLSGDDSSFDNTFHLARRRQDEVQFVYLGSDAPDDAEGPRYYLDLAFEETPFRKVSIETRADDEPLFLESDPIPRMTVVTDTVSEQRARQLLSYMRQGGIVLCVPKTDEAAISLAELDDQFVLNEDGGKTTAGYVMLDEIDFQHPIFAAFARPTYNDFTRIHFWKHRSLGFRNQPENVRVVARFDNGTPAIWEKEYGKGKLVFLASGWHPADSQLALSSKFVPLLNTLLDSTCKFRLATSSFAVNQPVPLPVPDETSGSICVTRPDGSQAEIGRHVLSATDQPGLYRIEHGGSDFEIAVNIADHECGNTALDDDVLEQYGVVTRPYESATAMRQRERHLRDVELENRQKIWRWLVLSALVVLAMETVFAGAKSKSVQKATGENG